jgi:hypothetical protein
MTDIGSEDIQRLGSQMRRFFGKYRAKVIDNEDPLLLGRIQAEVAILPGVQLNWCMPCTPYAGPEVGFYAIPPIGANVWVEFEGGDVNFPIWVGCFWAEGETPVVTEEPPNPFIKTLKTQWMTLTLDDTPETGGFTVICLPPAVTTPLSMVFNSEGVTITAPPALLKMITEEGITFEYPPGVTTMTDAGVETAVTDSTLTITEASIALESGEISEVAEGAVSIDGGADVSVSAGGALTMDAGADASLAAGAAVEVEGGGDVTIVGAIVMIN